jgi:hypothetical protein
MKTTRTLFHLMRADFLERVRSYGFLALLLFTIFLTYLFIPEINAIQIAGLNLGGYRAVYNSAWIGTMTTLLMGEFFLIFSFYLLKGSVERDRRTGVGQILAATPLTKVKYTLGKWLSNVAVVTAMTLAIIATSVPLQLIRAEDAHINFWQLASPFLIVLFPALTVIAATAVLFDSIPLLSGGVGNVLFFFIAYPILTLSLDLQGNTILYPSIFQACSAQFANCNPTRQVDAGLPPLADYPAFPYHGITWTSSIIVSRVAIIIVGFLITLLAAWLFHRFDPAKADKTFLRSFSLKRTPAPQAASITQTITLPQKQTRLTPLPLVSRSSTFSTLIRLFITDLRLTFKGKSWFWYICYIGLFIALMLTPLDVAQLYLLPLAFVLPLTIWSNLGVREVKHRADQIIFSAPHPLTRQLFITWLTGVFVAFVLTSPVLIRLVFSGAWSAVGGLFSSVLFVPSLALAFGVWTNGSKLFEGGYLFLWYIASMYGVPALDFMGRVPVAREQGIPLVYLLITFLLVIAIYFGRRRQAIK